MGKRLGFCVGALMLTVACGGRGSTEEPTASQSTSTTAPTTTSTTAVVTTTAAAPEGLAESAIRGLDYVAALAEPTDFGYLPAIFEAKAPFDTTDTVLRRQCGNTAKSPASALAGMGLEMLQKDGLASLTTSVQAFADASVAGDAFAFAKSNAEGCTTWTKEGDDFTRVNPPPIPDVGDESFSLFSRKPTTGLLVADHFVRVGQFVYNVRFAVDGTNVLVVSGPVLSQIAKTGDARFLAWAEEQLA